MELRAPVFTIEPALSPQTKMLTPNVDFPGPLRDGAKTLLQKVGLRPTRQRIALCWILFSHGNRHLTAEMLYKEASDAKIDISLATIYNALHRFTDLGLLREIAVDGQKRCFDTNTSAHHHFLFEGSNELLDIPDAEVVLDTSLKVPEGYEIVRIDLIVRLRAQQAVSP